MHIDKKEVVTFGKRLLKETSDDDLSGAAAEMAYRFFLAIFPFFIFLAAVGGFAASLLGITNPTDRIMNAVGSSLPADSANVLRRELSGVIESRNPTLLSIGIVTAIWTAASGVSTVMKGMNRAYDVRETRPMLRRYAISLGLTAAGGTAMIAAFVIMVVGQVMGLELARQLGLAGPAATMFTLARWPIVALFLLTATSIIYWAAPNLKLPFKWITPGALLFAIGWMVTTLLFSLYVSNFGSYNATYGALGSVVVLLIWFYLTAFLLLIGAEANAVLAQDTLPVQETQPTDKRELAPPPNPATKSKANGRQPVPAGLAGPASSSREASEGRAASPVMTGLGIVLAGLAFWKLSRHPHPGTLIVRHET